MSAITHIAGEPVLIDGRYRRQRCGWCGTVIEDVDLVRVAVAISEGEEPSGLPTWPAGAQIRVDGHVTSVVGLDDPDAPTGLADDSCARLPHELTGTPTEAVDR